MTLTLPSGREVGQFPLWGSYSAGGSPGAFEWLALTGSPELTEQEFQELAHILTMQSLGAQRHQLRELIGRY